MKTKLSKAITAAALAAAIATPALAGPIQINLDRIQPRLDHKIPVPTANLRINCPNPMIRDITAEVLSRTATQARVRITAVVENAGGVAYRSSPRQQSITLMRDNRRVSTQGFTVINPGNRFFVTYEEVVSRHGYGEFPPTFHARLAYDPDIRIDGNPANDDCRSNDNRRSMSGQVVNRLLR